STSVAAIARRLLPTAPRTADIRASAVVYDRLFPAEERHYARLAADAIGIPLDYVVGDDAAPFDGWGDAGLGTPEPIDEPFLKLLRDLYGGLAAHARVALTGWDGDTLLSEVARHHFAALLRLRRFRRLAAALGGYAWTFRELPPI